MNYFAEQDRRFRQQLQDLPNLGADADPRIKAIIDAGEKERNSLLPTLAVAMLLADMAQTKQISEHPGYYEKNPVLGRHPSNSAISAYFGANIIGRQLLGLYNPTLGLLYDLSTLLIQTPTINNNLKLGLSP